MKEFNIYPTSRRHNPGMYHVLVLDDVQGSQVLTGYLSRREVRAYIQFKLAPKMNPGDSITWEK